MASVKVLTAIFRVHRSLINLGISESVLFRLVEYRYQSVFFGFLTDVGLEGDVNDFLSHRVVKRRSFSLVENI